MNHGPKNKLTANYNFPGQASTVNNPTITKVVLLEENMINKVYILSS